jgi:hypothetical protein
VESEEKHKIQTNQPPARKTKNARQPNRRGWAAAVVEKQQQQVTGGCELCQDMNAQRKGKNKNHRQKGKMKKEEHKSDANIYI